MNTLKFVIVGHVDHGKSTLIGRLLYDTDSLPPDKIEEVRKTSQGLGRETEFAYLLDHLEEERQQGITIDTTQVFFRTDKRQYVIIDAPGHVEFVKNMITGASQAEAAILIIDVQQGIQEQTKRHAYILYLLGLSEVIVVLNKMDLVGFDQRKFDEAKKQTESFLDSLSIKPHFYIPICAINGDNVVEISQKIGWYKGPTLLGSLDSLKSKESAEDKSLLFPVQDVYKVDGRRIAVGRIETGILEVGREVKVLPSAQTAKIKSIERYLASNTKRAYAQESIGITTQESVFLNRGDIICSSENTIPLTDKFRANIFWMSKQEFRKDRRIVLRCATQETVCKIEAIRKRIDSSTLKLIQEDADILKNLEVGEVIIRTKKPIGTKTFNDVQELGRFVLIENDNICAGGIITADN